MLGKVIFTILLAVAVRHILQVLFTLDFHRTVNYHRSPGPCRQIMKENGSEDITVLANGIALISSSLYEEVGQIKLFDLNDPNAEVKDVIIEGGDGIKEFMVKPHGLSTWQDEKTGSITVAVITHPDSSDDRIEMYSFSPDKRVLKHIQSITDPAFYNLNDLVLISHDSFYTTKTHRLRGSWRTLESVLKLSLGEILFYDGKIVKTVASGLSFPNGINMSPSMRHIYMAEFISSTVHVYSRNKDHSLSLEQSVYLDSHLDNIEIDQRTGDLWIGSHYILHDIAAVLNAYETDKEAANLLIAPSQVFKLKTENGLITDAVEVYLNNGTEITGSSVAAVYGNRIIIGSIASQALVCELVYAD